MERERTMLGAGQSAEAGQGGEAAQLAVLRAEALAWLRRLHSGDATAEDAVAFERWRITSPAHAAEFAEASLLWTVLGDAAQQAERDRVTPQRVHAALASNGGSTRRGFLIGGTVLAASAAGLLLLRPPLDLWPSAAELAADYRTAAGERRQIDFENQVAVELNTRSSLDMRPPLEGGVQLELLSGEAAITSRTGKDAAVVVHAGAGSVMSRDATFNIRKDGSEVRVSCIRGRIDVTCRDQAWTMVTGQQVNYDTQRSGDVAAINPEVVLAWRRGMLVFHRAPLSHVIDEVNRYRAGRVVLMDAALGRRQVVANFRLDRIEDVINFISEAMNVRVRSLPGGVVLVG